MKRTLLGVLITGAIWAGLIGAYAGIEAVRGHVPFEMFQWELGGKFLVLSILSVLALGGSIGLASDRIQRRMGR